MRQRTFGCDCTTAARAPLWSTCAVFVLAKRACLDPEAIAEIAGHLHDLAELGGLFGLGFAERKL